VFFPLHFGIALSDTGILSWEEIPVDNLGGWGEVIANDNVAYNFFLIQDQALVVTLPFVLE
jgi:hypothetical protein